MATCYYCGEEIEFINNGFGPIPIHSSGSCSGRGGGYGGSSGYPSVRSTGDGEIFVFPFTTYPSYVNPNANCPVCGASVYFYQSPHGGRIFFDELGPPWPKHPCTDNPVVRHHFSSAEGRARILTSRPIQSPETISIGHGQPAVASNIVVGIPRPLNAKWAEAGWMPYVVTKVVPRQIGIEAEGKLFTSAESNAIGFRIVQASNDSTYYRTQGRLRFCFSLIQNPRPIFLALNECPIFLKKDPDLQRLVLSSFVLTYSGEIEEISCSVFGFEIDVAPVDFSRNT